MAFNTHDNHENLTMYYSDETVIKLEEGKYTKVGSVEKYEFGFQFPKCLRERIEKLSPENAKLTLNGTELKKWTVKLQADAGGYFQYDTSIVRYHIRNIFSRLRADARTAHAHFCK